MNIRLFVGTAFLSIYCSYAFSIQNSFDAGKTEVGENETVNQRIERLNEEGKTVRQQAESAYSADERACYKRFLVNRCIDQARQGRLEAIFRARALEAEARRLTLEEKQRAAAKAGEREPVTESVPVIETDGVETTIAPISEAERIRSEREATASEAEKAAHQNRHQADIERAKKRAEAEAEAAVRAKQAAEEKRRYDERIRQYEEERKEKSRNAIEEKE